MTGSIRPAVRENAGNMNPKDIQAIDVTTGDFDGDYLDEIAVAFRDASQALQVMQIQYDGNAKQFRNQSAKDQEVRQIVYLNRVITLLKMESGNSKAGLHKEPEII